VRDRFDRFDHQSRADGGRRGDPAAGRPERDLPAGRPGARLLVVPDDRSDVFVILQWNDTPLHLLAHRRRGPVPVVDL